MIIGIGVDIVHVRRMTRWRCIPGLLERYFHPDELSQANSRGSGIELSLAARFAAKEAFGKALGTGLAGIVLKDIMVLNIKDERPFLHLEGSALQAMKTAGADRAYVSLTHDGNMALASVILEM